MNKTKHTGATSPILIDENALAEAISVSVAWLRKDRRTDRTIPFIKLGKSVRYHLGDVLTALAQRQKGG